MARRRVRRLLRSPPAGCYASAYTTLAEQNTVGGTFYDTELDLEKLLKAWKTLTTANFTGRVLRVGIQIGRKIVNATALCFGPGSVQIMGSRNSEHMRLLLHMINDRFLACGYPSEIKYISLDNKVAAGAFGFYVRLEELHMNIPKFLTYYCPSAFPGLVSVWNDPDATKCTMVVFENGKVQVLGIEDITIANERYKLLCIVAGQYKVDANIANQTNKSIQRDVCNRNRMQTLALMPAAIRGNAERKSMKLGNFLYEYLQLNRHREQDTAFQQGLEEFMRDKMLSKEERKAKKLAADQAAALVAASAPEPAPVDINQTLVTAVGAKRGRPANPNKPPKKQRVAIDPATGLPRQKRAYVRRAQPQPAPVGE